MPFKAAVVSDPPFLDQFMFLTLCLMYFQRFEILLQHFSSDFGICPCSFEFQVYWKLLPWVFKVQALGCSKDLICSRGLVAVSKWPVETWTGTGSVINGESNLTCRQKPFLVSLAMNSLCSITTCSNNTVPITQCIHTKTNRQIGCTVIRIFINLLHKTIWL